MTDALVDGRSPHRPTSGAERLALAGLALAGAYAAWTALERARTRHANAGLLRGRHIVILGAGFAGIHVAEELARLLPDDEDANVTIVDANGYLLFTPMLTEVAGGELAPQHIVAPTHTLSPRVRFVRARVEHVDLAARRVTLGSVEHADGDRTSTAQQPSELTADHLVLALGSVSNFHGTHGAAEHALTMKSLTDATAVRDHALTLARRAAREPDHDARGALLTVVVGGGGYTGVETMAAVNDLLRDRAREEGPNDGQTPVRTVLIEAGDRLLPEIDADLAAFAQRELEQRGVEVRLKTKIARVDPDAVELEGGERIPTHTVVWAAGVSANPALRDLPCPHDHDGRLVVDGTCALPGHAGVWALGDCAAIPRPNGGKPYGPTAQNATREGTQVARNIVATLRGKQPQPFRYTPIGELALVGKRAGVAHVYGQEVSGFPAWALWHAVYLAKLPGTARRALVALDWLGDLVGGAAALQVQSGASGEAATSLPTSQSR